MTRFAFTLLLALSASAHATQAAALEPFVATYQVFNAGKSLGEATLKLQPRAANQWQIDLNLRGTRGLSWLAGLNIQQSTVFDSDAQGFRPLSQSLLRRALFSNKRSTGVYDWSARSAQWRGDVKKHRKTPVALQTGDMNGLLINLAVIRDAQPGKTLRYRFVDGGRARDHQYVVAPELESVSVGDLDYNAIRINRVHSGSDETVFWVVTDVPTPIRILQRENGQDAMDLRLIEYTGVQSTP